ncbi:MAG: heavy metal translocating P-type ATPase [Candidatus Hadarchaeaceae archaeon]
MPKKHEESCPACATDVFEKKTPLWKRRNISIILISGALLVVGLYFEFFTGEHLAAQIIFLSAAAVPWCIIARHGFSALFKKRLSMDFLMIIAAVGAFLIGHGEEGAAVILLFFTAEFLEEHAAERARKSVAALLKLAPEVATVKVNGKEVQIHAHEVKVNDIVIVKPGDRVPLDGVVVKGSSSVNQAPITGESMPVPKTGGDEIFAGTINEEGYLEARITKKSDETMLSKIVKLVESAQKRKSKTERFIDRFAGYYTPAVIVLALGVATIPAIFFGQPSSEWVYKALVLLVVSCPCALAISTPVSMVSAITSAARNGALIKGGSYIEEIKREKVLAMDKTGTLTSGRPEVTDIVPFNGSKEKLLQIAASIEAMSKHPIARAIVEAAEKKGAKLKGVQKFESSAGKGVKGSIGRNVYYIGSKNFFGKFGIRFPKTEVESLESEGKTAVLVGRKGGAIGAIAVMDKIRKNSAKMIKELKRRGVRTVMLTGDNERVAKAIANKIGVDEFYAELLPEDKVRIVRELSKKYKHVSMIGDGVNDAPALAKAHVGIAMGAIGSDVAIETADIALMRDDLSKVSYLFRLSKKTMGVVRQNIVASILIKGSLAVLAFPGLVTLWLAVAVGDMGLSLAVILNAIRLSRVK